MDDSLSWNYVNKEYINDMIHTYEISNPKTRISTTTAKTVMKIIIIICISIIAMVKRK